MPHTNTTKIALGESLKKLIRTKRLEKITINDLTADCGISRMAFYYHFQDIYDLVEWVCMEDSKKVLQDKETYDTWQEGVSQIFEAVLENKEFIINVCRSIGRERVERYLYKFTYDIIRQVVEEKCRGRGLAEEQKDFMTDFYKYGFVGIMVDWIDHGMKEDYGEIVENMYVMLHGNILQAISNFEKMEERETK
ncbi:MAG: TetR family transcriptional regulator C-terminal domain-containing protein [Lachnospiraceae bacterium]|nr:TetR family transcriptional regulator C-terminal domain-containing protein [Lachnospiraceae bacterium]